MDMFQTECVSVTIIIPTYNGEKFIEQTINSCLEQTYNYIKIIIIDDNSSDRTKGIIFKYKNCKNVRVLLNESNLGFTRTCNKAAMYADTDYLLFLGQDDLLCKNHIEEMLKYANENVAFIHCNAIKIDNNNLQYGYVRNHNKQKNKTKSSEFYLMVNNFISSTGLLINNNLFKYVGGYPIKYKNYGEWMLWISLSKIGQIVYCDSIAAYYRHHDNSITRNKAFLIENYEKKIYYKDCYNYASSNFKKGKKLLATILIVKYSIIIYTKTLFVKMWRMSK